MAKCFAGITSKTMLAELLKETGCDFSDAFDAVKLDRKMRVAFESELQKMANIDFALDSIDLAMCIASSSSPQRLEYSLKAIGLTTASNART